MFDPCLIGMGAQQKLLRPFWALQDRQLGMPVQSGGSLESSDSQKNRLAWFQLTSPDQRPSETIRDMLSGLLKVSDVFIFNPLLGMIDCHWYTSS